MNKKTRTTNPTEAVTGECTRWLYPEVFEPVSFNGHPPRYSVCLLIPKTDTRTVEVVKTAIQAAFKRDAEKFRAELEEIAHDQIRSPLRDGDKDYPDNELYAGHYVLHAYSSRPPKLRDADLRNIKDPEEIYGGCYGRAQLRFSFWVHDEKAGFSCWLNALQKCHDGERLDGSSVNDAFAAAAEEEKEEIPF